MRSGLIIILVGILFLFKNTGLISTISWDLIWPVIVILIGISIVVRKRCGCGGWGCHKCMGKTANVCTCDCDNCKDCDEK
jgi:hypothetical protein